ncbi:hypothetical protein NL676_038803 [Syzygium grande]|nr:hypothetical protein NL676_038803 [Syzygium grande]
MQPCLADFRHRHPVVQPPPRLPLLPLPLLRPPIRLFFRIVAAYPLPLCVRWSCGCAEVAAAAVLVPLATLAQLVLT